MTDYVRCLCFALKYSDDATAQIERFRFASPHFNTKLQSLTINLSRTFHRSSLLDYCNIYSYHFFFSLSILLLFVRKMVYLIYIYKKQIFRQNVQLDYAHYLCFQPKQMDGATDQKMHLIFAPPVSASNYSRSLSILLAHSV